MKSSVLPFLTRWALEETGADMLEYALVLALVTLAMIAGARKVGTTIGSSLNATGSSVSSTL
jgi:Flp pilus assembly pilin Flp